MGPETCRRCKPLFFILTLAALAFPALAEPPDPAGVWNGWVVYAPAQTEVEVTVELARRYDGAWVGTIDVPVQSIELMPLQRVVVNGLQVSFDLVESSGVSAFSGQLSADGKQIRGEVREGDAAQPFLLERKTERPAPGRASQLRRLSEDGAELRALFDQEADKVRLVVLVSPTCPRCAIASRLLEHYILDQVPDQRLRFYVVWGPMLGDETEEAAAKATGHLSDDRVVHFWTSSPSIAKKLAVPLGLQEPAWDVFLLFPPGSRWTDPAPAPVDFMHQRKDLLPADRMLDAGKLRDLVLGLLKGAASGPASTTSHTDRGHYSP